MQKQSADYMELLYDFLLECGNEHDPYHFCGTIAQKLHRLIPYDQARVIFLNSAGKNQLLYPVRGG